MTTVLIFGSLLFFYIENCYDPVIPALEDHEVAYTQLCQIVAKYDNFTHNGTTTHTVNPNVSASDRNRHVAEVALKMCNMNPPKVNNRKCELTLAEVCRWFDFTTSVAFTTGKRIL